MNSYLHIKSFLGQEKTIELLGGWIPLSFKDKVKKINSWFKNQSLLSVDQNKELGMTPYLEEKGPAAPTNSKPSPELPNYKAKRPKKKQKGPIKLKARGKAKQIGTDITNKTKRVPNWSLKPWTVCSIWPEHLWSSQPRNKKQ
ncbi:hypothetical protein O181_041189 [Austropuccinia psidii MF-1]|uniref:Uncharacterized protein n=1 Tax=Austropuccinia psidii MF-1 TaxID=1389203 RepID=A0A9Q3HG89_9BASI|nr:hypothetical protein [Austropuccinia psidii MF-1]